jgi:hypothetical protein
MKIFYRALLVSLALAGAQSEAAVTINIRELGSNVVADFSGSLTNPSCISTASPSILSLIYWNAANDYTYTFGQNGQATACTLNFVSAQPLNTVAVDVPANSSSGGPVGVENRLGGTVLYVPLNYAWGSPISGSSIWNNQSFSSLHQNPGTYSFNLGADTVTINVGSGSQVQGTPVPANSPLALLLATMGIATIAGFLTFGRAKTR